MIRQHMEKQSKLQWSDNNKKYRKYLERQIGYSVFTELKSHKKIALGLSKTQRWPKPYLIIALNLHIKKCT